jgi:hypothetical protein
MKRTLLPLVALVGTLACARADIIARWTFNDTNAPAASPPPVVGTGTALLIGGVTAAYVAGASPDNTNTPNKAWSTKSYPAATNDNKTAGAQFNVSTVGYHDISLNWYQENSQSASRYARVQYTLDGSTFADADVIAIYKKDSFTNKTVNLSPVSGTTNNPFFGFRIVTEFEDSATGSGLPSYVATTTVSNYTTSGTIHYDLVTVFGTPFPPTNYPPAISALSNQTVQVNQSTPVLPFTILDDQTPGASLTLAGASSNPAVVPASSIVFGGSDSSRTVAVTASSQPGSSLVTVYVMDASGASNSTSFTVTVLAANTAPSISAISRTNTLLNTASPPIGFTVGDLEMPAGSLTLSATSANTALVPNANIVFGGSDSNRTVTVTPAGGQTGVAPITITVSDGTNTSSSVLAVMVTPSPNILFCDPFTYANGSLLTNSGFLWDHGAGTTVGECLVTNGQLQVTAAQTEDVSARLIGAPYAKNSNTVLYAAFKVRFLTLPKSTPDYFAHFISGSAHRGRIYAGMLTNGAPGALRLYVSNGSDTNTVLAGDLNTNAPCTLVLRYDIDAVSTTLWLNPTAESDPGATAADSQSPGSISSFNFRQDSGCGATMLIDDLKVGLSFAAVTSTNAAPGPIPLVLQRSANNLILRWTDPVFGLQAAPAVTGTFTNVSGATSPYTNASSGSARFFRLVYP